MATLRQGKLITLEEPNSMHVEMYRSIRMNIEYSAIDNELKTINITSTSANEAKTTTACNLAVLSANKKKRVLLIDLDLRSPSVHKSFNMKNQYGITDLLIDYIKNGDKVNFYKYLKLVIHPNIGNELYILPVGTQVVNSTEILSSKKIVELLNFLKKDFNEILIDSSPSGLISDGILASSLSDGTIYIVESGKTKIDEAQKVINQLKSLKINILGVVLTKVPKKIKDYGYYRYSKLDKNNQIKIDVE